MPRDEHGLFARDIEVGHGPLHRLQHRIIAAARAPAHFLVAGPVLGGRDGRHLIHVRYPPSQAIKQHDDDQHDQHRPRIDRLHASRLLDRRFDFGDREGLARNLGHRLRVDQELVAKDRLQLPAVHLGDEDMLKALEQDRHILGHRHDVADVDVADASAPRPRRAAAA